MRRAREWTWAALAAALLAAGAHGARAQEGPLPGIDEQAALRASQAAIGREIGPHALLDRDGSPLDLGRFRGKPLLVSFVYTGCFQVCPTTTRTLHKAVREAQSVLGPDAFNVVTIGFNQPFDSPAAMASYARQNGVDAPNWRFLAASPRTVEALTRELGFTYKATPRGFDHITQVSVVDAEGRVYRQVYGESFPLPQLVGPLKELVRNEPIPNTLSDLVERVRIFCTVYDPATGTYRVSYTVVFEIVGGGLFLLAVAWRLVREWRAGSRIHRA